MRELTLVAIPGIPEVREGDVLSRLIGDAARAANIAIETNDVLVIAQKIVSKAEGRTVALRDVEPSPRALELARGADKDARLMELVLRESREVLRVKPGVVIVEHRLGHVMANAGIDRSNVGEDVADEHALLLPVDPDDSARRIRDAIKAVYGADVGVIINDSFGRAWRHGVVGIALGIAGIPGLVDMRGQRDRFGRELKVTQIAAADELAAAASLMMGQAAEGCPVVLARGFPYAPRESTIAELIRPRDEDLFR
jgi:coenzyme F420-0:L-glutamate ligase/coenzyme F420-1:gamma-L-glutamate ligase